MTVQAIIWPTGIVIPPHDHRMWAVVGVVHGQEDNALYARAGHKLRLVRRVSVEEAEVLVLDEDSVHAVGNPCSRPTLGLHVYGGDIVGASRSTWDSAGCNERPFDPELYERFATGFEQLRRRLGREPGAEEVRAFTSDTDERAVRAMTFRPVPGWPSTSLVMGLRLSSCTASPSTGECGTRLSSTWGRAAGASASISQRTGSQEATRAPSRR